MSSLRSEYFMEVFIILYVRKYVINKISVFYKIDNFEDDHVVICKVIGTINYIIYVKDCYSN